MAGRILLADDDNSLRRLLTIRLETAGYEVLPVASAEQALEEITAFKPAVVVTDLRMEAMDGLELLERIQQQQAGLPVILITAHGTIPDAVKATRLGAFDFVTKPIDDKKLLELIERATSLWGEAADNAQWREDIISCSPLMETLLADAKSLARSEASVLLQGNSGSGKELMARAIHKASARRKKPFVAINCGALPEQLLEAELFGHEKGAFTDAHQKREGLFRAADGGTLFLDEIGDMPMSLQVKLLRALEEREVRPLGSSQSVPFDVRLISATHQDLEQRMAERSFREDLYYRINVVTLKLPSLEERREDIPLLVNHFLKQLNERGEAKRAFAAEAMECIVAAAWPGNIRQLRNFVEQCVALATAPVISAAQVRTALGDRAGQLPSFDQARYEFTRDYLIQLLQMTQGNVSQAARLADRNRTDFYKLLSRHDIEPAEHK
ncbi:MAG: sigma 54-interacting transcriptional regulator [Salinisphaeraceae bacterium]|nr:sigma 54-interacting transcriptional regulator [Salinisphaeraceae bacterium]